jgi:flagella basal body P-ring formation protein FlgA
LACAPAVRAQTPAAVPEATLARALSLVSEAAATQAPPGARIQALPGTLDARLKLAPCTRVEPYLPAGVPAWGRTRVGLQCAEGPTRWKISLPVTVQVWAPAVVPGVTLPAGARLEPAQLVLAETDWSAGTSPPFADIANLAGRTLARAVAAGQALRPADLHARQWFGAGAPVRVVAGGSGFAVSAEGVALAPGVEGQLVRVRIGEDRIVVGRPVGERVVEVGS